jgi:hypothetical protein
MKTLLNLIFVFLFIQESSGQSLLSITPNQGTAGTTVTALITGQNTFFQSSSPQGAQCIYIGPKNCNAVQGTNFVVVDEDHMQADFTIPSGFPNGIYDINLQKGFNVLTLPASFTILGGTDYSIQSISPTTGFENSVITATITGQNLQSLFNSPGFYLRLFTQSGTSRPATNITVVNPNTLTANFQFPVYSDTGYYILNINSSIGCFSLDSAFYLQGYYPKRLVSISPPQGNAGTTLSALVTGQNLFFQSSSPQGVINIFLQNMNCNTINGTNIVVTDNDHFTNDFVIPSTATNGVYDVYVTTNTGHTYVLPASYTITNGVDRNITGFTPSLANAGTTFSVTITGNDLINLLGSGTISIVNSNGQHYYPTNIVASPTQATMDFLLPLYAVNGFYDFVTSNAYGCFTFPQALQIQGGQPRQLVSIVPNQGCRGETLTAIITGSNTFFMNGTPMNGIDRVLFIDTLTSQNFSVFTPNITVIDSNHVSIDFTIPFYVPQGVYDVSIVLDSGGVITLPAGFEVTCALIQGFVYLDLDSNGIFNAGDSYLPGRQVLLVPGNIIFVSGSNGQYRFAVDSGQYTISIVPDTNWIITSTPQSYTIVVDNSDTTGLNFGMHSVSTVGVFDFSEEMNGLSIYPNPTHGKIRVQLKNEYSKIYDAKILDLNGRLLKRFTISTAHFELDMNQWSAGIYYLLLTNSETGIQLKGKIIKN